MRFMKQDKNLNAQQNNQAVQKEDNKDNNSQENNS